MRIKIPYLYQVAETGACNAASTSGWREPLECMEPPTVSSQSLDFATPEKRECLVIEAQVCLHV